MRSRASHRVVFLDESEVSRAFNLGVLCFYHPASSKTIIISAVPHVPIEYPELKS